MCIRDRAVILASGGYGHNRDIVPEEYFAFRYSGHSGHDGDALEMIKAVDGATRNLTWLNKQPNTMILPSGAPQYTNMGVGAVYKMSGILAVSYTHLDVYKRQARALSGFTSRSTMKARQSQSDLTWFRSCLLYTSNRQL